MFVQLQLFEEGHVQAEPVAVNLGSIAMAETGDGRGSTTRLHFAGGGSKLAALPYAEALKMIARYNRPWTVQDATP